MEHAFFKRIGESIARMIDKGHIVKAWAESFPAPARDRRRNKDTI